jgi:hypothetical protein
MSPRLRWFLILLAAAFVAVLVFSSMQQSEHRYEVCVSFGGSTHCAVASGATPDAAIQSAKTTGCALLTASRDENIRCLERPPASVRELK